MTCLERRGARGRGAVSARPSARRRPVDLALPEPDALGRAGSRHSASQRGRAAGDELAAERVAEVRRRRLRRLGDASRSIPSASRPWIARSRTSVPRPPSTTSSTVDRSTTLRRTADEEHGDALLPPAGRQDEPRTCARRSPRTPAPRCRPPAGPGRSSWSPARPARAAPRLSIRRSELPKLRDRDADEDPEHERDEDCRQRDDVVAEVEHGGLEHPSEAVADGDRPVREHVGVDARAVDEPR